MGCCRHSKPVPKFPSAEAELPARRRRQRKQRTPTSVQVNLKPKSQSTSESPPSPIISLTESPSESSRRSVSSSEDGNVTVKCNNYQRSQRVVVNVQIEHESNDNAQKFESDSDNPSMLSLRSVTTVHSSDNKSTHTRPSPKSLSHKTLVKNKTPKSRGALSTVLRSQQTPYRSAANLICASDISLLLEVLVTHTHKWERIGVALGFSPGELEEIKAKPTLLSDAPHSWLRDMLNTWVQWTPETQHGKYATLENLLKALKSKTVGLAVVAEEVFELFSDKAKLKADCTREQLLQDDCNQPDSGKQLESVFQFTTALTPPAPNAPPIDHYAYYLQCYFALNREPADKWPQIDAREYIHLAVVSNEYYNRKDLEKFRKATLHGSIDDILKSKSPIEFSDLLKPKFFKGKRYAIKRILLEGAPGIGKSTISWEICRKWGNGELFQEYSLVVLIRFRDPWVQKVQNISDLFRFPGEPKMQRRIAKQIKRKQGKGLLLILEGFDEAPPALRKKDSIFFELFKGLLLPNATVIITTRPSASYDLQRCCKGESSRRIEVLGFGEKEIKEYIEAAFVECTLEEKEDFYKYLELYPHIYSIMYVPLNSAIVTHVYQSYEPSRSSTFVPKTMTQLYTALVKTMLLRYMMELPEYEDHDVNNFSDLPNPILEHFAEVCKLAYQGITKPETQIIFSTLPKAFNSLGLMQSVSELYIDKGASVSHNFLHLTIQEYLAAYHLSQLREEEQATVLRKHLSSTNVPIMVRFLAGLSPSLVSKVFALAHPSTKWIISKSEFDLLFELQNPHFLSCIFGTHHMVSNTYSRRYSTTTTFESMYDIFQSSDRALGNLDLDTYDISYTAFEYYVLGYCVGCSSSCQWKIKLEKEYFIEMFTKGILSSLQHHDSDITCSCMTHLQLPSRTDFDQLAEIVTHFTQLQELDVQINSSVTVSKLLRNIPHSIISLAIRMAEPLCKENYEAIADLLSSPNHSLKILSITAYDDALSLQYFIDDCLSQNTSLEGLCIYTSYKSVVLQKLSYVLLNNDHLVSLCLESCSLKDDGAIALCEVLRGNSKLSILRLGTNSIGNEGAIALAKALETNSSLESLSLYKNNISNEGAAALAHMLTINSSLINLDLRGNKLEDEGVMMLLDSVRLQNTTMKMLKLQNPKFYWRDNLEFESPPDCDRIQLSPTFCKRHRSIVPPKPQVGFPSRVPVFQSSNPDQTHTDSDSGTDYEDID